MKKIFLAILVAGLFLSFNLALAKNNECTTIQSGELLASDGSMITTRYDQWGYNYQAHIFNGWYDNYSRPDVPVISGDRLMMKWNDAWLSNKDCDGDNLLDRHYGYNTYIGSGAWLTNHARGSYEGSEGQTCLWSDFVKIVAVPEDAVQTSNTWYDADGTEIGPSIWGQFAIIQEVSSDPCGQSTDLMNYKSQLKAGLGNW